MSKLCSDNMIFTDDLLAEVNVKILKHFVKKLNIEKNPLLD